MDDEMMIDDQFDEDDTAQYIKTYMFIKGFAYGRNLRQTMLALSLARKLHNGQHRNDGSPYVLHPLKVCTTLISMGIDDDVTLAAALLHDVLEDCSSSLPEGGKELVEKYRMDQEVLDIIRILTKKKGLNDQQLASYFERIKLNPKAALIKLSDRLHNSTTMYVFSRERMRKYIRETNKFILPLASYCKKYYPEYLNIFGILKNNISTLNASMSAMQEKLDAQEQV